MVFPAPRLYGFSLVFILFLDFLACNHDEASKKWMIGSVVTIRTWRPEVVCDNENLSFSLARSLCKKHGVCSEYTSFTLIMRTSLQ